MIQTKRPHQRSSAEIIALREEVAGLRQEMQGLRLLEHKADAPETATETPRKWWELWKR